MKPRPLTLALLPALAALACKSADKGGETGESITKAADQIELCTQQLDATVAALHAIVDKPATDLTAQRKTYEKALSSLEGTAADLRATAEKMRERGKAYFAEWDQQLASIQNEDIGCAAPTGRKEIEANFSKLQDEYGEAKGSVEPLLADLSDVRTVLKADTTMAGIDGLKPTVKKVDKESGTVGKALKDLGERFRQLGVSLSRSGPKPPEAQKK
jgi:chromosome segregation ATPase